MKPWNRAGPLSRRDFLQVGAVAGAGASFSGTSPVTAAQPPDPARAPDDFNEATIAQLQAAMASDRASSAEPALIRIASGFEHATHARIVPQFFPTLPQNNISGVPLGRKRRGPKVGHRHMHLHHL